MSAAPRTLQTCLVEADGRPSGFDYLRISLSVSIIAWHTIATSYGFLAQGKYYTGPFRPLVFFLVPSFFALSGFLVAGSLFRNTLQGFLTLRALRIFPALACEVLISAFILGPALTSFTLKEYFSDSQLYAYFLNLVGDIQYTLPGLFLSNPAPDIVNVQLWTIPYELECYIALAGLMLIGAVHRPRLFAAIAIALLLALTARALWGGIGPSFIRPSGRACVLSFLWGVLFYLLRMKIPAGFPLFVIAAVLSWLLLLRTETVALATLPIAYATIWFGVQNPRRIFLIAGADYSYGMYLYGFPIQQSVAQLLPGYRYWYVNLVVSLAVAALAAYLSWNLIEKRILGQKNKVVTFVNARFVRLLDTHFARLRSPAIVAMLATARKPVEEAK